MYTPQHHTQHRIRRRKDEPGLICPKCQSTNTIRQGRSPVDAAVLICCKNCYYRGKLQPKRRILHKVKASLWWGVTHPKTGETLSLRQWSKRLGWSHEAIRQRVLKLPLDKALEPKPID